MNQNVTIKHDGSITISTGKSRRETKWKNKTLMWSELIKKLSTTNYTNESLEEFKSLPKEEQDRIKDRGGFVGGALSSNRRRRETVENRSLITLDMDEGVEGISETIQMLFDFSYCIYSTHKHTPKKPRLRILMPLSRPVTPEEYQAAARMTAGDIGMEYFDPTTFEPSRLMYWPSTSRDGVYEFKYNDGKWLNPDETLKRFKDWKNIASWPEELKQRLPRADMEGSHRDPGEKSGFIGAFCKVYPIQRAIEKFLGDVYVPCPEDSRYTYAKGSTTGGLVVYEDGKYACSFHGTDPAGGGIRNSFDLVRIHKFGRLDENTRELTETTKLPSFKEMIKLCQEDDDVRVALCIKNFSEKMVTQETGGTLGDGEWLKFLDIDDKGKIRPTTANIEIILQNEENIKGKIAYNEFSHRIMIRESLPWHEVKNREEGDIWGDFDDSGLRSYLETIYNISMPRKIQDGLFNTSKKNEYHPIREYLSTLKWDGTKRVEEVLINYLGAEDSEYIRTVTRKALTGAVARILEPGVKFDYMLVLFGKQGIGKSRLVDKLAKNWFSDSITTLQGKESFEQIQGKWILEFAELSALKRSDSELIKHYISKRSDSYRPAYGRYTLDCPRQCIFIGTTNEEEFLKDKTGNRRFWPVKVGIGEAKKDILEDLTGSEIDQIWAEAIELWKAGEQLFLDTEMEKEALKRQQEHTEKNPLEGPIREYLEILLPENWDIMDIPSRRRFIHGSEFGFTAEGKVRRDKVCAVEIWVEMLQGEQKDLKNGRAKEINDILRGLEGWRPYSKGNGKIRFGRNYGAQRAFVRGESEIG